MRKSTKAKILAVALWTILLPTIATGAGALKVVKVAVQCNGEDSVGMRLCLALKDKIRGSASFELVDEKTAEISPQGFEVHMISEDIENTDNNAINIHSAIALTFTVPSSHMEQYIDTIVSVVGSSAIDEEAATLLANIDRDSDFLRHPGN